MEEKQRGVRKKREQEAELAAQVNLYTNNFIQFSQIEDKNCILQEGRTVDPIEPHWFKLVPDPYNGGKMIHEYRGDILSFMQHAFSFQNLCIDILLFQAATGKLRKSKTGMLVLTSFKKFSPLLIST